MLRARYIILSFLCLFAFATQVQANYAFTHSDHLGSASWITDFHGEPVQYIHYAPYGELLASQHAYGSSYDERYKFTGKERDVESGYDYYGARYQIVPLGIWGSPDPMLDKYIHLSPYMYCNGNPIKFIDPNGRKIVVGTWYGRILAKLGVNNFEAKTQKRLQYLKTISPELKKAITSMEKNEDVTIQIFSTSQFPKDHPKDAAKNTSWEEGVTAKNGSNSSIYYQEDEGFIIDGNYSSADAILAHELGHAENNMNGTYVKYDHDKAISGNVKEKLKGNANEKNSIFYENQVRQQEGEHARSYDYYKANTESDP